ALGNSAAETAQYRRGNQCDCEREHRHVARRTSRRACPGGTTRRRRAPPLRAPSEWRAEGINPPVRIYGGRKARRSPSQAVRLLAAGVLVDIAEAFEEVLGHLRGILARLEQIVHRVDHGEQSRVMALAADRSR